MDKEFSMLEKSIHKLDERFRPILALIRRRKLNRTDFSIIANNCLLDGRLL